MDSVTEHSPLINIDDAYHQTIVHSKEENVIITIEGLKHSSSKQYIWSILTVLFLGTPWILAKWYPQLLRFKYIKTKLEEADLILVRDNLKQTSFKSIQTVNCFIDDNHQLLRYFVYQHTKYLWQNLQKEFTALDNFVKKLTLKEFYNSDIGVSDAQQSELLKLYGWNKIDIEMKPYRTLFVNEVFNPFYMFQIFSVSLWFMDEYQAYAGCILVLSALSIITSLRETKKQSMAVHNLVEASNSSSARLFRPNEFNTGDFVSVDALRLVPGDIISIPPNGCVMACDAVLLSGNCIVNESMLTGESVPVTKTPPNRSNDVYDSVEHKKHTLFSGTRVIQTRYLDDSKVLARVVHTGFETAKGKLIKSILYPKPVGFKFYRDSMRFVRFLFIIASAGMSYSIYLYLKRKASTETIVLRALDIVTIVVPPALPAAMTAGTVYSQNRLKKLGIFCISPPKINMSGKVKLVCFDKTGTLTEEGLSLYGVIPIENNTFGEPVQNLSTFDQTLPLIQALATCHSLTRINNKISGDPLDLEMFEATGWVLDEPGNECTRYDMLPPTVVYPPSVASTVKEWIDDVTKVPYQIGILRQFPFSSSQQSMSVICRVLDESHMNIYTKGAPERIIQMCDPESIPTDFFDLLKNYAIRGHRIIAMAYKQLGSGLKWTEINKIEREKVEKDLQFLGLLIMQNTLKPETTPIIKDLHNANIRTIMITGDNIMTAISVSRECGMVQTNEKIVLVKTVVTQDSDVPVIQLESIGSCEDFDSSTVINMDNMPHHLAIEGKTWSIMKQFYPSWISKLLLKGTVFARCSPEQKTQIVTQLQELDYVVGMVGDGANDCGALKAAHIGISLSQAEASVAAPFTSSVDNISCVKSVILEGRCALVTSYCTFKYMAMYSLIQFASVVLLCQRKTILGNWQFLFIDLIITTTLAITMGRQGPFERLVRRRPTGSLMSAVNVISLLLQIAVCIGVQIGSLYFLTLQDWYEELETQEEDEFVISWDNTVIFTVSNFQYLILAYVYSKGKPYRQPLIRNGLLVLSLLILTILCVLLTIYPIKPLDTFFELEPLTKEREKNVFRYILLAFPVMQFIISACVETFFVESRWFKSIVHFFKGKKQPKNKYKVLNNEFSRCDNWLNHSPDSSTDMNCR